MSRAANSGNAASPRNLLIAALATFAAVTWWGMRGSGTPVRATQPADANLTSDSRAADGPRWPEAGTRDAAPDAGDAGIPISADIDVQTGFAAYVEGKYKFLTRSPRLMAALLNRERIAVAINTAKQSADASLRDQLPILEAELVEADRNVGELLIPRDVAGFEVLKDSDMDQFQFEDYVGGVSNVVPLTEDKQRAILFAKLANRQRFRRALETSGLMRGDLTASQRQLAFNDASRALRESRDGFLQEARQHLHDEEQFTLLSNYENTEFSGELDKLRRIADGD